jgi:hypothetical protein
MSFPRSFLLAAALAGGVAIGPGCLLDGSAFESAGAGGAGGDGAGTTGTGGPSTSTGSTETTGSTSSTTTTTGSTTTATTTTTPECMLDTDCPDPEPDNDCVEARCASGACSKKNASDGMSCGTATGPCHAAPACSEGQCLSPPLPYGQALPDGDPQDCKMPICDGQGGETTAPDDTEDPDDTECATKLCSDGDVKTEQKAGQATCLFGALKCCDGHCCDPITCLGCID